MFNWKFWVPEHLFESTGTTFIWIKSESNRFFYTNLCLSHIRWNKFLSHNLMQAFDTFRAIKIVACLFADLNFRDLSSPSFQKTFRERKYFSCAFCSYRTKFKYNLIRHVQIHGPVPSQAAQFKCTQCPFESDKNCKHQFIIHSNQHIFSWTFIAFLVDDLQFVNWKWVNYLSSCNNNSLNRERFILASLQRHLRVHSGIFYKCAHCDFETKHKENLPKHLLRHKDPSECRMYDCDECDYETKDKLGLKRHMLTHR